MFAEPHSFARELSNFECGTGLHNAISNCFPQALPSVNVRINQSIFVSATALHLIISVNLFTLSHFIKEKSLILVLFRIDWELFNFA